MSLNLARNDAIQRLARIETELNRQLEEVCSRRSVSRSAKSVIRRLPCALNASPSPRWTAYEFGCGTAAFSKAFLTVTRGDGGVVTVDNDPNACAHKQIDYASYLCDGLDADFAKCTPNVLVMCSNCTSNSKMSVLSHRRSDDPVNGNPTSIAAQQAISFANSSNDALWRIMLKALRCNPQCILIIETPAGFIEHQPVYYDKFLRAFELTDTRVCRCKLYKTPHRKETIILNNMTCWPPNGWDQSRRMCFAASPCDPLIRNKTGRHQNIVCGRNASLSAQFEAEMALDFARACFVELTLAFRDSI
jgi:hypothetical protein